LLCEPFGELPLHLVVGDVTTRIGLRLQHLDHHVEVVGDVLQGHAVGQSVEERAHLVLGGELRFHGKIGSVCHGVLNCAVIPTRAVCLLRRLLKASGNVLEKALAVHHAQDANTARLDAIHQPVFVDEGLAPFGIFEFGNHAAGVGEVDNPKRGFTDLRDYRRSNGQRGNPLQVGANFVNVRLGARGPSYVASHLANR
jgi:hypothetical protein